MMDKEELWKCEYLQQSFSYLTEENLDWLEQHCEKTIRRTTGNTLKEHLMVLELIKDHKQYLSMRADYIRRMKASNEVLRKQGYISKNEIKEIIIPTPDNPISLEIQSSEFYKRILSLLEEK